MKNKAGSMSILMIVLLSCSITLSAQNGRGRGGMYGPTGQVTPALTEKQITDMATLRDKYIVESDTLRAQLRRSTDIKKRGELAGKIQILSDTYKSDANNLLTAEQKKSIETAKTTSVQNRASRDSLNKAYSRLDSIRRNMNNGMAGRMGTMRNSFNGRGMMQMMPMMPNGRGSIGSGYSFGKDGLFNPGMGGMGRRR
jgi:hypothetical protein